MITGISYKAHTSLGKKDWQSHIQGDDNDFTLVTQQWGNTRNKITTPHKDHGDGISRHSVSDCSHTDTFVHADFVIGLVILGELKNKA
jgi:hypothetical protein